MPLSDTPLFGILTCCSGGSHWGIAELVKHLQLFELGVMPVCPASFALCCSVPFLARHASLGLSTCFSGLDAVMKLGPIINMHVILYVVCMSCMALPDVIPFAVVVIMLTAAIQHFNVPEQACEDL